MRPSTVIKKLGEMQKLLKEANEINEKLDLWGMDEKLEDAINHVDDYKRSFRETVKFFGDVW